MSNNLLSIERAFLSIPAVKQGLKLAEFKTLQRNVENAQKKKFDTTLELSKVVLNAFNWFKSTEGQALCIEEGISWSSEDFGLKVFGFQKSYFYKLTRAGKLENQVITDFKLKCTELESAGESPNRSLEGLLKYAKDLEQVNSGSGNEGESGGEGEAKEGENEPQVSTRPQNIFTFEYKPIEGSGFNHLYREPLKVTISTSGELKIKTSEGVDVPPQYAKNVAEAFFGLIQTLC